MKLDRLLKTKAFAELSPSQTQLIELDKVLVFLENDKELTIKKQATIKNLQKLVASGVERFYVRRLIKSQKSSAITKKKMLYLYGKCGFEKWDSYVNKQRISNTFEYKSNVHGMSRKDFDEYNQSRAQTLENMVSRYGDVDGTKKWNEYVERQRYVGCKLEYFVEKYGKKEGEIRYNHVCELKIQNYANALRIHGDHETALVELDKKYRNKTFFSKQAMSLFNQLNSNYKCYHSTNEYGMYDDVSGSYFKYDFVIHELKVCIEFNGDHYHANPKIYKSGDIITKLRGGSKLADDIWLRDSYKLNTIKRNGFNVLVVWASEYEKNEHAVVEKCQKFINDHNVN